jgi:hypothetical protein
MYAHERLGPLNHDQLHAQLIRAGKTLFRNTPNGRPPPVSTLTADNQLCITRPGTMNLTSRPSFAGKPTKRAFMERSQQQVWLPGRGERFEITYCKN